MGAETRDVARGDRRGIGRGRGRVSAEHKGEMRANTSSEPRAEKKLRKMPGQTIVYSQCITEAAADRLYGNDVGAETRDVSRGDRRGRGRG